MGQGYAEKIASRNDTRDFRDEIPSGGDNRSLAGEAGTISAKEGREGEPMRILPLVVVTLHGMFLAGGATAFNPHVVVANADGQSGTLATIEIQAPWTATTPGAGLTPSASIAWR